jgi:SAM-dependent methyltransferase
VNNTQPADAAGLGRRVVVPDHLQRHPDRDRWNARYQQALADFTPHELVESALHSGLPEGPVLELACGRSGSALALAAEGRSVVAVDVSDVALGQLADEATRRGLTDRIEIVLADVSRHEPEPARFALVIATFFWDADAFLAGCRAVRPGGLLAWEALASTPGLEDTTTRWRIPHGELSARLPAGFQVLIERSRTTDGRHSTMLLARRDAASQSPE